MTRSTSRATLAVMLSGLALVTSACSRRGDDPVLTLLGRTLKRGERVLLVRPLEPEGNRMAMVVGAATGKPELRIYERAGGGDYLLKHTAQQGDAFRNLSLEDVDGDGQDEIVTTWEGGHLELVEVLARGPDASYRSIFQNAGRQIERRYNSAGLIEFWITSRTYGEGPGESPAYATTVYRFEGGKFIEATLR